MSEDGGDTRVDLVNRLNAAIDRIEELEAALRKIVKLGHYDADIYMIARAVLPPENSK